MRTIRHVRDHDSNGGGGKALEHAPQLRDDCDFRRAEARHDQQSVHVVSECETVATKEKRR